MMMINSNENTSLMWFSVIQLSHCRALSPHPTHITIACVLVGPRFMIMTLPMSKRTRQSGANDSRRAIRSAPLLHYYFSVSVSCRYQRHKCGWACCVVLAGLAAVVMMLPDAWLAGLFVSVFVVFLISVFTFSPLKACFWWWLCLSNAKCFSSFMHDCTIYNWVYVKYDA